VSLMTLIYVYYASHQFLRFNGLSNSANAFVALSVIKIWNFCVARSSLYTHRKIGSQEILLNTFSLKAADPHIHIVFIVFGCHPKNPVMWNWGSIFLINIGGR
jgi:hypothetical protein